jgi:excisionase family DNA binding protein
MPELPDLLTLTETAAYLRMPAETLRKWRAQGLGPRAAKVGRHLRYRRAEVDRGLAEREREATSRAR